MVSEDAGFVTGVVISETISIPACVYPTVTSVRRSLFTVWSFYFWVLTIISHSYNNQTTRVDLKQEAAMKYSPAVKGFCGSFLFISINVLRRFAPDYKTRMEHQAFPDAESEEVVS